jgi:hypothetical protein
VFNTAQRDGLTLHSMPAPFASPSWSVVDGHLIFSPVPSAVGKTYKFTQAAENQLIKTEPYRQMMARVGGPADANAAASRMYADFTKTAPQLNQGYMMALNMLAMSAGDDMPFEAKTLLPRLSDVRPHLGTAGSVSWTDDQGFHYQGISPFPGASLYSPEGAYTYATGQFITVAPMLGAFGVYAREEARENAMEAQSMANLRQIAVATVAYSVDHDDQMPGSFTDLIEGGYLKAGEAYFHTADPARRKLAELDTDEAKAKYIAENSSYVLIPIEGKLSEVEKPSERVLVVQRPGFGDPWELPVAYADGHVEKVWDTDQLSQTLKQQTGKTLKEWTGSEGKSGDIEQAVEMIEVEPAVEVGRPVTVPNVELQEAEQPAAPEVEVTVPAE